MDESTHEDARYLAGSPQRVAMLGALCESSYRPTDLTEEVDAARTTVQRVLSGFLDRHWAVKREGRYRATITGRRVHEQYAGLLAELERARDVGALACHLGGLAEDLPAGTLDDAAVTLATDQEPLAAVDRLLTWFDETDADHVRGLSPVVARTYNEAASGLIERGVRVDLVIDEATLERSIAQFRAATERGVEADRANVFVVSDPLPFGLVVGAATACLGIYDDENNLRGLVVLEDDDRVEWARDRYERFRTASVPLGEALDETA